MSVINRKTKKLRWSDEDVRKLADLAKSNALLEDVYTTFPDRNPRAILERLNRQGFKRKEGRISW